MAKIATKLEDLGDERWQAVFLVVAKEFFNGDIQAMLDYRNKALPELENSPVTYSSQEAEVQLKIPHQCQKTSNARKGIKTLVTYAVPPHP